MYSIMEKFLKFIDYHGDKTGYITYDIDVDLLILFLKTHKFFIIDKLKTQKKSIVIFKSFIKYRKGIIPKGNFISTNISINYKEFKNFQDINFVVEEISYKQKNLDINNSINIFWFKKQIISNDYTKYRILKQTKYKQKQLYYVLSLFFPNEIINTILDMSYLSNFLNWNIIYTYSGL